MKTQPHFSFRKILLMSAATVAAFAVAVGLPIKKALAAPLRMKVKPAPTMDQPEAQLTIIQPKFVNPSAEKLVGIADKALSDNALAERIFSNPDAVAAENHLSKNEILVLRHMDREQFQTARDDAARLVADRMARGGNMRMPPGATDAHLIAERMVVGRAILAAVGRSYLEAANAHACCPWSKSIELGVNSDPAVYNVVFEKPAEGVQVPYSGQVAPESGVNRPQ